MSLMSNSSTWGTQVFLIQHSPAVFRNLQRPCDITLPQNTRRCNPSAWFHCPLSYPRFSEPPSSSSPCALHQDPHLPPLTHRRVPQKRTRRPPIAPVCLPGKLHTHLCRSGPHAPACLYLGWVVCVDVETSLFEAKGLSSAGRR